MSLSHDSISTYRLPAQRTSFVGRERELASILALLSDPSVQLITLTGPGGVGKTRLAERVAHGLTSTPELELGWISLAPLESTEQVARAIGQQFGLRSVGSASLPDRLAASLLGRPMVLVLDNVEHLLSAAPLVAELVDACPTLVVLATSRGPLNISREREVMIEPLPLPSEHASRLEIEASPAVRLFLERATAAAGEEPIALETLQSVEAICRRLDGLPLAIELAASWSRLLTPSELRSRLDRRLPLLVGGPADVPPRLQSMSGAIGWSYALLDQETQQLFRWLSVFPEVFTLEAAEFLSNAVHPIAQNEPVESESLHVTTLGAIASLASQGLVSVTDHYEFRMLQTIREFGLSLLTQYDELERCGWAHLGWCVSHTQAPVFDPLDGYLWGRANPAVKQADLTAALSFALDHGQFDDALRLAITLSPIWAEQGRYAEARGALERIRNGLPASETEKRAVLLGWTAEWAWLQGDYTATRRLAEVSLDASLVLGSDAGVAANRYRLGRVASLIDPRAAVPLLLEALEAFRSRGEVRNAGWCLIGLGHAELGLNETPRARAWFDQAAIAVAELPEDPGAWIVLGHKLGEARLALQLDENEHAVRILTDALALSRTHRNHYFQSLCLSYLCDAYRREKSYAQAVEAGREGLQISQLLGHRYRERQCLIQLEQAAFDARKLDQAMLFDGAAGVLGSQLDFPVVDRTLRDQIFDAAPAQRQRLAEMEATGRRLTGSELLAQVIALELDLSQVHQRASALSSREEEVLRLLAEGATNGEIADRLFVSRRTVDTHVGSILRKLHVASRREAVTTARQQGIGELKAQD